MPELPEVETVRRTLTPELTGRLVTAVEVLWAGALAQTTVDDLRVQTVGACFTGAWRRGKYLGLQLDRPTLLVVHLRMTGRLFLTDGAAPAEKHLRVRFRLDDGRDLRFIDQRKFGKLYLLADEAAFSNLARLGPEPLSPDFTPAVLAARLRGRHAAIKAVLLDQRAVCGLGNIYADESLFAAGIQPQRPASSLDDEEIERLWGGIRTALQSGLVNGGTTFRDYVDGQGRQGRNQEYLFVYGRGGEPCLRCGQQLAQTRVTGRGTVYCRECQR